jgi:hypothetical protein
MIKDIRVTQYVREVDDDGRKEVVFTRYVIEILREGHVTWEPLVARIVEDPEPVKKAQVVYE